MSTADFAAFSNNAVMFASIVYVLAFVAHVVEWATGRAAVEPAREAALESALAAPAPPGAVATSDVPPAEGDEERVDRWGRIGLALTVVAVLLHFAALVARGLGSDPVRVPWGNMYEFTLAGAFGVSLMYVLLGRRYGLRWMGLPVTGFEVVVLMLAVLLLYVPAGPLVPALHSYWLVIHVMAAVVASGAFAVGAIAAVLYLVKDRARTRGSLRPGGYLDRLPDLPALDRLSYRLHAFGFPIWTFAALVAGPIWAEYAWGRYWNWDPKEVWAFITWVVYAAYLHARATAGWRGKAAAVIALVGFATLLFNFVGINFFFGGGSLHSYAG
ncbi:MAG TPA: c-type cytochrome biogenesis protein CcsB [Nocardioides sp.]|uniref:c-type cytochrome biogenesis protein CcsB n=1 Tax=Nocardioides sp. TaxID=35761 RepID=UPI002D8043B5|nr:c-type cytochrome biogenesis protein CcsB [Nocardioides sp.]HET6653665.1 c-type cytochrome biogenesis protein CcsB [Nocardioides sp.]